MQLQIEVLGSSSSGNAYIVSDGDSSLLLECGLPIKELQTKSNFRMTQMAGCLISHLHL